MQLFIIAVYATLLLFPAAEVFLYPGITINKIGISPYMLALAGAAFSIVIRCITPKKIWKSIGVWSLYVIAPCIIIACLAIRYLEVFTYPNFVFTHLGIDMKQAELFSLYIILMALPYIDIEYIKKHIKITFLVLSVYLYHLLLLSWSHPDIYIAIKKEDSLIEYLTFFAFLIASFVCLLNLKWIKSLQLSKPQKNILIAITITMSLGLLVIAGEEISWGQRVVGIETPEHLAAINTQEEINLHNNRLVFQFVYDAYMLVNLYGLLSWLLFLAFKNKVSGLGKILLRILTSRWHTFLFFIPNLVYVLLMDHYISSFSLQWEELTELYLACGILAIVILNVLYLKNGKEAE